MGTDSIHQNCYITIVHDSTSPYGRMVCSYDALEDANKHILYQKKEMKSNAHWSILHIKDIEWIKAPEL